MYDQLSYTLILQLSITDSDEKNLCEKEPPEVDLRDGMRRPRDTHRHISVYVCIKLCICVYIYMMLYIGCYWF
ncbi:hypothetical protein HanPSC8_Chr09g0379791 [Helianthus annuus]|nr:hypothetical protein HanPSC8_Chr09g0379791 [Helianthus annuus]